jgi:hypothetical protein
MKTYRNLALKFLFDPTLPPVILIQITDDVGVLWVVHRRFTSPSNRRRHIAGVDCGLLDYQTLGSVLGDDVYRNSPLWVCQRFTTNISSMNTVPVD